MRRRRLLQETRSLLYGSFYARLGDNRLALIPLSTIPFRRDSDFADHGAGNIHWKVPRATNSLFTGRKKVLERVKNILRRDVPDQKRFIITGLGGLGKSEICLKIANEMRQEYATTLPSRPVS